ncbi:MAG: adenylate/guanylate cyclase domain-containing protein, partial [Candidatus Limnocylindria bacterium]
LPPAARFCPTCAAPVETDLDRSERKLATIVFADLVGSTELAGSQDAERTRLLLERFYDAMAEEIDLAGGTVEKFAGDAVMAAFGAPASLEDHAERALHAALAMQRRMRELFNETLSLRIGVNTGEVVVGRPRERSSFVTGDAVNVAARLEQAAQPGEILVGDRTFASVRGAFEFDEPKAVQAKGKPDGVIGRPLLRALSLMRLRGVLGLHRSFVGRDDEMLTLQREFDAVEAAGTPRLVTILGDAGVGKSRIVREFWERLGARQPEPLRRTGRCLAYGQGITYWPLAEVLKEHHGIMENDPPSALLDRLGSRQILGMALGLDVTHGLHPLAARDQFQDAWVEFVEELASDRTVVMLIEDIHWAEDLLVDLLERLVRHARRPLLLIVTGRPELLEQRPGWGAHLAGATVTLEPLASDDSRRMLTDLLGGAFPSGLSDVVERAEGNPFFVEEVLGTLIDRNLLERTNGSWRLAPLPQDFHVPDTVQAVVAARIDLLGAAEKQALQAAALIGRIFWAGPVYELVDGGPDLRVLEARDFVRRRLGSSMAGEREYAIKHALTREVAYDSLPRSRRAGMHARFAQWVEERAASPDEVAPILAHHYAEAVRPEDVDLVWAGREQELAGMRERAVAWLGRAAKLAIGRMEIDDAVGLLHRALELETDPPRRAPLWKEVGRASVLKFDGEAFWTSMQEALGLTADPAELADLYAELAFQTATRRGMWMRRPSSELIEGWVTSAMDLAAPGSREQAKALIATAMLDRRERVGVAEEAFAIANRMGDIDLQSSAMQALGGAALARGDYNEAYEWFQRNVTLVEGMSDPDRIAYVYGDAAGLWPYVGKFREARDIAERQVEMSRRLSAHHRLHAAASVVFIDALAGDWQSLCDYSDRAESAFAANLATPCMLGPLMLLSCARGFVHRGNDREARRLQQVATDLGMEGYDVWLQPSEVALAIARGDLATLERKLEEWKPDGLGDVEGLVTWLDAFVALDRKAEIEEEAPALVKPGTYLEPFALRALGYARHDDGLMTQAIALFDGLGLEWFASQTRQMLSDARE